MKKTLLQILAITLLTYSTVYGISLITKPYTFTDGTKAEAGKVNINFDTAYTGINAAIGSINAAAGTKSSLAARLDYSLNSDGTFKNISGVTAGSQWLNPAFAFQYSSSTKFLVTGNQTDIYLPYRRVKANLAGGAAYSEVASAVYASSKTHVTLADAILTDPITSIEHSIITPTTSSNSAISARVATGYTVSDAPAANQIPVINSYGDLTLPHAIILPNDTGYYSKLAGGDVSPLIKIDTSDQVVIGRDTVLTASGNTIWTSGNDGPGSGLAADTAATATTATSATTATNASGTGNIPLMRSENSIRILRGTVGSAGNITGGVGFSVSKTNTGVYTVTFAVAFSAVPSIIPSSEVNKLANFGTVTTGGVTIYTTTAADGTVADAPFSFIAIGPN